MYAAVGSKLDKEGKIDGSRKSEGFNRASYSDIDVVRILRLRVHIGRFDLTESSFCFRAFGITSHLHKDIRSCQEPLEGPTKHQG